MKLSAVCGTVILAVLAIAACVGDDPNASGTNNGTPDGGTSSSSGGPSDSGGLPDTTNGSSSGGDTCRPTCKTADVLVDCSGREQDCALGCSAESRSCRSFDPVGPLATSDLTEQAGELDVDLPATPEPVVVDTTNGAITHISGAIRAANKDAGKREVVAGIGFERRGGVGVFRARSWTLRNVIVQGDLPVAFVGPGDLKVRGHVSTLCGQAGGAGTSGQAGNGGSGQASSGPGGASGGGGGGHGTAGGKGGDSIGDDDELLSGGAPGPEFVFNPQNLRGGGRGASTAGSGGGGGGVVILASGAKVLIGDGVTVSYKPGTTAAQQVRKGVSVGGCGGSAGRPAQTQTSGGGGGAGGLILVEAPVVLIDANAGLAANGGGGGGTNGAGADAKLDDVQPLGGTYYTNACATGASGGKGAAGANQPGPGLANTPSCGEYTYAGGGGGAGGRIVIRNKTGNVDDRAPTSILSPKAALQVSALTAQ